MTEKRAPLGRSSASQKSKLNIKKGVRKLAPPSSKKYPEKKLIDSLQKVSVTHGLVLRGPQVDFLRLLRTLEQELPDLYVVYQTSSGATMD